MIATRHQRINERGRVRPQTWIGLETKLPRISARFSSIASADGAGPYFDKSPRSGSVGTAFPTISSSAITE